MVGMYNQEREKLCELWGWADKDLGQGKKTGIRDGLV